eukprot:gene11315-biopygen16855
MSSLVWTRLRRVYARSLQKGPIDGTHGCPQKTVFSVPSGEAGRPSARPKDAFFRAKLAVTCRLCCLEHNWCILGSKSLECAPFEQSRAGHWLEWHRGSFFMLFGTFWCPNPATNGLKPAQPQILCLVCTGAAVRACVRPKDAYFWPGGPESGQGFG